MSPTRAWREPTNTSLPGNEPRIRQLLDALKNNPTTSEPRYLALQTYVGTFRPTNPRFSTELAPNLVFLGANTLFRSVEVPFDTILRPLDVKFVKTEGRKSPTYLIEEGDCSSLKVVIAPLAPDLIPRSYETYSRNPERASSALGDLVAILNALEGHYLQAQCFDIIAERWTGIMQWLSLLAGYGQGSGITFTAMFLQEAFLRGRPCRDELMHHPSSLKYLMLLLTRLDLRTGRYLYTCEQGTECSILWLLGLYLESDDKLDALLSHIKTITPECRRSLVSAIVARPMQIAATACIDRPDLITFAAKSVRILFIFGLKIMRDPSLSRKFLHRNLFGELGKALFTLADMVNRSVTPGRMLCWTSLATCLSSVIAPTSKIAQSFSASDATNNLPLILSTLLEPGMVSCAIYAFKYMKMNEREFGNTPGIDRLMEYILRDISAHMTVSRIARAVAAFPYLRGYDGRETIVGKIAWAATAQSVFDARKGIHVDVCNNLKHSARHGLIHADYIVRKCSGCECVVYCSRECQKDDWGEGHKDECRSLRLDEGHKLISSILCEIRRDQLTFVEHLANQRLPLILQSNSVARGRNPSKAGKESTLDDVSLPSNPEATVSLFDATLPDDIRSSLHHPISTHTNAIWRQINGIWDGRVHALVKRAAERPEETILVETVFELNYPAATYVLVEMRYDPGASRLTKLKVVNSVFRVGLWGESFFEVVVRSTGRLGLIANLYRSAWFIRELKLKLDSEGSGM
ncbi:hypothetical protein D9611_010679 [Ephemerocybe angulata]|uniref:MYND-type domain-containing protein n=1 Tax=Ephemerocybe angulata TaxID=980116 RepID=A0A8H5BBT4_9AGAR|nr:hypothetical protein D9611_010679 [Tulosesus angulatus]